MRRWNAKRLVAVVGMVGVLAGGAIAVDAPPAFAGAYGCSSWKNLGKVGRVPIYSGYECVTITGQRKFVQAVGAAFASAGNVCNWNITAEFFDTNGRWYKTYSGKVHKTCARKGNDTIWLARYMKAGKMCSTLKTNGARITSVCHSIR